jgi:CelD/BcsL family acetyltransferase involved in cellulose biosynthesis
MNALAAPEPAEVLHVEEIVEPAALEALAGEWGELFAGCPDASPFQSPQWLLAWRRAFLAEGLWALAVRRAGRLVGLAPLYVWRDPDGGRQLTLLGNGVSDRLDLLARPEDMNAVAQAVFERIAASPSWDRCDFRDLPADSPLARLPLQATDDLLEDEQPCPAVELPAQAEAVWELAPRKRRDDLRRCARRASESGELAFETAGPSRRAEFLAELAALHEARWRARGEPGVLADPAVLRFQDEATAALDRAGWLRLHRLRLGGRTVAVQYALQRGRTAYSYLTTFDAGFARLSPGMLLTAFTLEQAVREGARRFDFLRGREAYKYQWGASDRPQARRCIRR